MLTVAVPKRNKLPNIIVLTPKDGAIDYTKPEETGLPSANVLIYKLEDGATVIVRPSGTEPKIKIYYTTLGKDLEEAKTQKEKLAEAMKVILA